MNRESAQFILREMIDRYAQQIDRLYDTTIGTGYVHRADPMGFNILTHWMRNDIVRATVENLTAQDYP